MEPFSRGGGADAGVGRVCRLPNTVHTEIAPTLSLPSLPPLFGAVDPRSELSVQPGGASAAAARPDVLMSAPAIADLLARCDACYLNLKEECRVAPKVDLAERSWLYQEVIKHNQEAFSCPSRGPRQKQMTTSQLPEKKPSMPNVLETQKEQHVTIADHPQKNNFQNHLASSSKKPKVRKRDSGKVGSTPGLELPDRADIIAKFCEIVEDFCGSAEASEELGPDYTLPITSLKHLVNEITLIRSKKILSEIPLDTLTRIINVLDHQIHCAQGLSIDCNENGDLDAEQLVLSALESSHAALAIMAHQDMPKQLYREEVIERILDFTRRQIMDCMAASNPSVSASWRRTEEDRHDGSEEEPDDIEMSSSGRQRRNVRSVNMRKSAAKKVSGAVYSVIQKLSLICAFLRELLTVVRLSDSCILQLVKTSFSTFLVDNMQILQLKAIDLICGVFSYYTQHRTFLVDETVQLLHKLQFSKRAVRTYHLPDEEQKQIQMITALLVQLIQFSAELPESLKSTINWSSLTESSVDASYPMKCHESATEASCQFWAGVLQRLTTAKAQDVSEVKSIIENLVTDLLITLNLPEYPASAHILEVLCVLLLQNAGLKSKDTSARCFAIDLLGTIAARLKSDAVICNRERLWILQELDGISNNDISDQKDICCVCLGSRGVNVSCHLCGRCFHSDCIGENGRDNLLHDWCCHLCFNKKELSILQSCYLGQNKGARRAAAKNKHGPADGATGLEVVQQILLSYLQDAGLQDDGNLFTRWFYLCMWYKNDPQSQDKIIYYLARLKSKEILRTSGNVMLCSREWAKKISLALGQKTTFSRGFDKILTLLLTSLRESSPVIRARALRAVSGIVEADPEVLCDKRVRCAVEGRFCDSAISVREAALELVGRHIASHPDVGLQYFEKVAERIKDTGVSVRKRAIKIVRDLCVSNPEFSEAIHGYVEILSRVNDEESSVQDLVCKTFYEFWFEEPTNVQKHYVADGSSVPLEVANKTEQIVSMLRRMTDHQSLVTIIRRNLTMDFLPQSAKASGVNAATLASVRKRCELICKRLLERILQVEEATVEEEVEALPYVLALHAFCIVDPTLCAPVTDTSQFVVTLQPYLKNNVEKRSVAKLLESIIFVIDAVLPLVRKPPKSFIEELERDLTIMIARHSFLTVVHACIKCLCSVCKTANRGATLVENLVMFFSKHLVSSDSKQFLGRSLFCLGLLLRYGYGLISACGAQFDIMKILGLIKRYLLLEDFGLKVRALQALGYIVIAKPEYMLEKDILKLMEASLSASVDSRLKIQGLQNLHEYLVDAEEQLSADNINKAASTISHIGTIEVPVAAGAGDTNICGGIIQLYWNCILDRCLDMNAQVREFALKIVEIVLRQGLVHPITCVPHLIALETDPVEDNSKLAHHLLINMNEKYPSFFESRLGDGLQMSFAFYESTISNQSNVAGTMKGNPIAFVKPGIARIYRLIRANRASRNKFMHSIIRKFEQDGSNHVPINFLVYCTEVLASLPFTCPDEPLYLIYDINRIIQLRAGGIEANMKYWSSISQFQEHQDNAEIHRSEHDVNVGLYYSNNGVVRSPSSISQECMLRFQAECHAAIGMQLLLKLKRYLKILYGLNDARCQAFSLKELPKSGETLSKQNIQFNISNTSVSLPTRFEDMVRVYQDFKTALREDTMDYVTYTAAAAPRTSSAPRKRPTPRSSRVRKRPAGKAADDSDEDDDRADENWTGRARVLDFGGMNGDSGGGRVTRQRVRG